MDDLNLLVTEVQFLTVVEREAIPSAATKRAPEVDVSAGRGTNRNYLEERTFSWRRICYKIGESQSITSKIIRLHYTLT